VIGASERLFEPCRAILVDRREAIRQTHCLAVMLSPVSRASARANQCASALLIFRLMGYLLTEPFYLNF
jgi:hypothetical protein